MAKLLVWRFLNMKKTQVCTDLSLFSFRFSLFIYFCLFFVYYLFEKRKEIEKKYIYDFLKPSNNKRRNIKR